MIVVREYRTVVECGTRVPKGKRPSMASRYIVGGSTEATRIGASIAEVSKVFGGRRDPDPSLCMRFVCV